MVKVCDICGHRGFSNVLLECSECANASAHQYCLGIPPGSIDDTFDWVCECCSIPLGRSKSLVSIPVDIDEVLTLQDTHRSRGVWDGETTLLRFRQHHHGVYKGWHLNQRILHYVERAGFGCIHRLVRGGIELDRDLITALAERWRQETHTFHLVVGEATITLQDVAVILGLRVHGSAVIGHGDGDWSGLCEALLGRRPENPPEPGATKVILGSSLKLTWLRQHFGGLPLDDADDLIIQRHARAYILMLMGSLLFPDKSGDSIQLIYLPLLGDLEDASQYSWGSAVLAYLYRQLCRACRQGARDIGGCLLLLQLWSWEHIHIGRPEIRGVRIQADGDLEGPHVLGSQHQWGVDPLAVSWLRVHLSRSHSPQTLSYYRDSFDRQREGQMTWQPYSLTKLAALPDICVAYKHIWRTRSPLICFDVVEFHLPDRVMRQFGLEQLIPYPCDTDVHLHAIDRRTGDRNFVIRHAHYLATWTERETRLVDGDNYTGLLLEAYMAWYRRITRMRITNPAHVPPPSHYQPSNTVLANALSDVVSRCQGSLSLFHGQSPDQCIQTLTHTLTTLNSMVIDTLDRTGYPDFIPASTSAASTSASSATYTTHFADFRSPATSIRGCSTTRGRAARSRSVRGRSPSSLGGEGSSSGGRDDLSPFVSPTFVSPHPERLSPSVHVATYQHRSPSISTISEAIEDPTPSTAPPSKRTR